MDQQSAGSHVISLPYPLFEYRPQVGSFEDGCSQGR